MVCADQHVTLKVFFDFEGFLKISRFLSSVCNFEPLNLFIFFETFYVGTI